MGWLEEGKRRKEGDGPHIEKNSFWPVLAFSCVFRQNGFTLHVIATHASGVFYVGIKQHTLVLRTRPYVIFLDLGFVSVCI